MWAPRREATPARRAIAVVLELVGLAGLAACMTVLFLSMRAVMDVGGACASGGAFEIRQECPEGVAWLLPASIISGIALLALYAWNAFRLGGPNLTLLAWPALFISLGWNFMEYAVDPPGDEGGPVWGWLVPGVLFLLMGGVPLVLAVVSGALARMVWGRTAGGDAVPAVAARPEAEAFRGVPPAEPDAPPPAPAGADGGDVIARIERLDALRRGGAIDRDEYERLKDQVLREAGAP